MLDAPAFLGAYSRLLIDLNRPLDIPGSIPVRSEATIVPGNDALSREERERSRDRIFAPFQQAVAAATDRRIDAGLQTIMIPVHSLTPAFLGVPGRWPAGGLFGDDQALRQRVGARPGDGSGGRVWGHNPRSVGR